MDHQPSPAVREKLVEAWLETARAEHTAIASFTRLTLLLMGNSAPHDLLADTLQAGLEEVDHAKRAFALTSRFLGDKVNPEAYPLDGDPLGQLDLASVTLSAVVEGCVGETISALMSKEALRRATDPEAKEVLEAISADESRHADLAWRVARWALEVGGLTVRAAAQRGFSEAEPEAMAPAPDPDRGQLNHYGVLTPLQRHRVAAKGWREIVNPAREALFDSVPEQR